MFCCRIDQRGEIKVADFGLTEDMYARNYFRHNKSEGGGEEKVPIRWMAPESIESGIYNEKTDVVCRFTHFVVVDCKRIYINYVQNVIVFIIEVWYVPWSMVS